MKTPQEMTSYEIHEECVRLAMVMGIASWCTGKYVPPTTTDYAAHKERFRILDLEFGRRFHSGTLDVNMKGGER